MMHRVLTRFCNFIIVDSLKKVLITLQQITQHQIDTRLAIYSAQKEDKCSIKHVLNVRTLRPVRS